MLTIILFCNINGGRHQWRHASWQTDEWMAGARAVFHVHWYTGSSEWQFYERQECSIYSVWTWPVNLFMSMLKRHFQDCWVEILKGVGSACCSDGQRKMNPCQTTALVPPGAIRCSYTALCALDCACIHPTNWPQHTLNSRLQVQVRDLRDWTFLNGCLSQWNLLLKCPDNGISPPKVKYTVQ